MEDMHNYVVDSDTVDIIFDKEELDDSDVEEDHMQMKTMEISPKKIDRNSTTANLCGIA